MRGGFRCAHPPYKRALIKAIHYRRARRGRFMPATATKGPPTATAAVHLFGIRHHGPGSARSVREGLKELRPDCVLVEGPPDADALLPLLAHEEMTPPVALLVYAADRPSKAVYYPF